MLWRERTWTPYLPTIFKIPAEFQDVAEFPDLSEIQDLTIALAGVPSEPSDVAEPKTSGDESQNPHWRSCAYSIA